jgi:hypothetical protein
MKLRTKTSNLANEQHTRADNVQSPVLSLELNINTPRAKITKYQLQALLYSTLCSCMSLEQESSASSE